MPRPHDLDRRQKILALTGVLLALLLAGLDQTIVATAGPAIQRDLRIPPALYPWITTAYLVSSTVMLPIYGKLSDSFGRKPILLVGIGLFLAGSFLCGFAPGTMWLIAFRALQGLGAASLFTTAFAVIADLFPPAERAKYMGLIGGVFGVASVIGPLAGGFLTDTAGWHWVFFVNLPVGAVASWFIITKMPRLGGHAHGPRPPVDVVGAICLIAGVVPLLIALSLGRARVAPGEAGLPWSSWPILAMFAIAAIALVAFFVVERRVSNPLLDLRLLRIPVVRFGVLAVFVLGGGFLFAVVFLPLYMVNVVGVSATEAGLALMPLTMGIVMGSVVTGQLVSRIGRYKPVMLGGLIVLITGFTIMGFTLTPDSTQTEVTLKMLLIGIGIGPTLPLYPLVIQNASPPRDLGVVTAATTFSRSLGQVIGVAFLGTLFANALSGSVASQVAAATADLPPSSRALVTSMAGVSPSGGEGAVVALDTAEAKRRLRAAAGGAAVRGPNGVERAGAELDASLLAVDRLALGLERAFTDATKLLFRVGIVIIAVGFVITLLIPELPLRGRETRHETPDEAVLVSGLG